MEKIDFLIRKVGHGFIESGAEELREAPVACVMVTRQGGIHAVVIKTRMIIAPPGVYGKARGVEREVIDGLTKGSVGVALMGAEFDEDAGT